MKLNCWEFKKCGREPGGAKVNELGICPAATDEATDNINCGKKGGRACWVIAGTLCGGQVQGTFALKYENCMNCEFYKTVRKEEGKNYRASSDLLKIIQENKDKKK
ncbi:MAG: hypothetical protein LHV68_00695 [Elusimicrobia bacterium]|nr:hypothetical protein [Candidatus Liberimonas magnetica]